MMLNTIKEDTTKRYFADTEYYSTWIAIGGGKTIESC